MNDGIDETTEYLLEEYALDRLTGEGLARVEEILRANPTLRARVSELRAEARLLSGALANSARDDAETLPDTTMALLLDGALDELERATLEASLAGDLQSQARLTALYREANAVINNEPMPERPPSDVSIADVVIPLPSVARTHTISLKHGAIAAAGLLVVVSFMVPARAATPTLFLALGAFGWWSVHRAVSRKKSTSTRSYSYLGMLPALIMFVSGLFAGPYSLWCYVCSAGWYWYWLVQRLNSVEASSEGITTERDEAEKRRVGSGRG